MWEAILKNTVHACDCALDLLAAGAPPLREEFGRHLTDAAQRPDLSVDELYLFRVPA